MEFNKLRLLGFKSFVEPTEFAIERGLTGVVGPNGCGKSNLVEAMRWVMGEASYKNMRASSMDDVIFSGSGNRPSRNMAEVALFLDNSDRTAPAAFNDAEELQVSRRIEREAGSVYRINGRDVRAKDVQLLFADVSTGARSPSMIGQGRIGELISAKPQARRALLEEAAGISGLHSRRHEAELRLRAAETNLDRLEDVVLALDAQIESLKRQARQAVRYRNIAGDIRRAEATILHLRWSIASAALREAASAQQAAVVAVAEAGLKQGEAVRLQAVAATRLPDLRQGEAKSAAALQHATIKLTQLDDEERRANRRARELEGRVKQLDADIAREEEMVAENSDIIALLGREEAQLVAADDGRDAREAQLKAEVEAARASLDTAEAVATERAAALATARAQHDRIATGIAQTGSRLDRLRAEAQSSRTDLASTVKAIGQSSDVQRTVLLVETSDTALAATQAALADLERGMDDARAQEAQARDPLERARAELAGIETEARTLSRMLDAGGPDLFAPVLDSMKVEAGFEQALGAALGEDLDVPLDNGAKRYWGSVPEHDDPALPEGAIALKGHVKAPPELARRLAQVGIVADENTGERLAKALATGQCLVTPQGALWRWDGYRAAADAKTAATVRLEQRNRLAVLEKERASSQATVLEREKRFGEVSAASAAAVDAHRAGRDAERAAIAALEDARRQRSAAERSIADLANRRSALEAGLERLDRDLAESEQALATLAGERAQLANPQALERTVSEATALAADARATFSEARALADGEAREATLRRDRLAAIARERETWAGRAANADRHIRTLRDRQATTAADLKRLTDAPDAFAERRRALQKTLDDTTIARQQAADRLAKAETELREADGVANAALSALADAKSNAARAEERENAATERRDEITARIREDLECEPHQTLAMTGETDAAKLPERAAVEARLERLRAERERLGAVNLLAEKEQSEIVEKRDELVRERDDVTDAIRQLRTGISSLNKEGRERLLVAFDEVNLQFQKLFTHLFGGGTAELQLVESDDPLEAGLEILARPPGKKPQTMTLLSGGEQALTAMALIFAVFLTNPAPICVLDEVDAPLDDHNVERFCNLMDQMAADTDTRFVIITHNPITMARMDRLFGVTMAERGVSQLVSVDLSTAETFREAG